MKTLRISDDAHQKLTGLLGELTAQTMKMQTYTDAIETLLGQSVILPPELLAQVEEFINEKKHLGLRPPFKNDGTIQGPNWSSDIQNESSISGVMLGVTLNSLGFNSSRVARSNNKRC